MTTQRLAVALTGLNLVLLLFILGSHARPAAADTGVSPVLRGQALEIVDNQGRVRASISVLPPSTVDHKDYPETVLLRLIDPTGGPIVKLGASINGSGLNLTNRADGGIQMLAQDTVSLVRIVGKDGRVQVIRP
jgi:hypothetical protein